MSKTKLTEEEIATTYEAMANDPEYIAENEGNRKRLSLRNRGSETPRYEIVEIELSAEIDLNVKDGDGLTFVRMDKVDGTPKVGEPINVYESEDNVVGFGVVERISDSHKAIYIRVDWDSIHDVEDDDSLPQELMDRIEEARLKPWERKRRIILES